MYAVERLGTYISRGVYTVSGPFHPFGGAVDIIVVQQPDGTFKSSPWYVRFGKFQGVLKAREKIVNITINGAQTEDLHMYLDHKGEAYFLNPSEASAADASFYPSSSGDDETEDPRSPPTPEFPPIHSNDPKVVVARTTSRRSRIFGMVFGRRRSGRLEEEEHEEAGMVLRRDSLARAELAADLLEVKWSTNLDNRGDKANNCRDHPVVSRSGSASQEPVCFGEEVVATCAPALLSKGKPCSCSKQSDEGNALGEKDVDLIGEGGSVECGADIAQSFLHCQTSEISRLELDGSAGAEACPPSEVHSPNESMALTANELKNVYLFNDRGGSDLFNNSKNLNITMSASSVDVRMIASDATANAVLEDIQEDMKAMTEICKANISLQTEEVKVMASQSSSAPKASTEADLEESTMVPKPFLTIANSDPGLDSILLAPSEEIRREDTDNSHVLLVDCVPAEATIGLLPQGLEEAQFLFSDLDSKTSELEVVAPKYPDFVEKQVDSLVQLDGLEGVNESMTSNYESPILSDRPVLENLPNDTEKLIENTRMMSSAISIPSSCRALSGELGQVVRNLRNTWSHPISDVASLNGPLSRSLDSNSEPINWTMLSKGVSNCLISDAAAEQNIIQEWPTAEGNPIPVELQNVFASGGVEISLCKHLLCKGMGAEAASQAFDSEKLYVHELSSLSSDITKDDRLVVRISNHYFPWDVAAPFILKMISLKGERLINPKGVIAVDKMENTLDGDPTKAIIARRSGSWRIWPFERSNSKKGFQATLNGGKNSNAGRASENGTAGVNRDKDFSKMKVIRNKVRTTTPTSEQLASLKLNEGRNIVTFTFSTAVLGKQQVDARIYLWKWNTRIVISDVDGTITKSDVLGQFMPMVGVDWSHTGVTHLFSAIQENGYKMLFLSARAISQAYHTRQFLFNLKQNGKALPDGPVVISPDGVFPSLFREVIRRAPHEFKIACLEDIKALFPSDCNPFYAGFGNRDTDEISYLKVGIPRGKIFIINPKGEVVVNRRIDTKSYTSLHALVHDMFPSMSSSEQEDYNSWNFWKLPPPSIDVQSF